MDLASPVPVVSVSGFDHVTAEWTLDAGLLSLGTLAFVIVAILMAAVPWRHL